MGIQTSLDDVRGARRARRCDAAADDLAFEASRSTAPGRSACSPARSPAPTSSTAIAATHALGRVFDEQADVALSRLLSSDRALPPRARRLGARRAPAAPRRRRPAASAMVVEGGFAGMLAAAHARAVVAARRPTTSRSRSRARCSACASPDARYRARRDARPGARPHRHPSAAARSPPTRPRTSACASPRSPRSASAAATAGVAARSRAWPSGDGYLARRRAARPPRPRGARAAATPTPTPRDRASPSPSSSCTPTSTPSLTQAGSGDNGGIATLLVRLGDALRRRRPRHARVDAGHHALPRLGRRRARQRRRASPADDRPRLRARPAAERARAVALTPGRCASPRGAASAGCCAPPAASTCCTCGWPTSAASPPPTWPASSASPSSSRSRPTRTPSSSSLDLAGALTRANFGEVDEREHFWFRARLVQRLAADAAHTVLFPRPELATRHARARRHRHHGAPRAAHGRARGHRPRRRRRAVAEAARPRRRAQPATAPSPSSTRCSRRLPAERRGLPLARQRRPAPPGEGHGDDRRGLGRRRPARPRATSLIVGGDLDDPSADEREQLDAHRRARAAPTGAARRPRCCRATARTTPSPAGSPPPASACPGSPRRAASTCAAASRRSSASPCSRRWPPGWSSSRPTAAAPRPTSSDGVTGVLTRTWDVAQLAAPSPRRSTLPATEPDDARADRSRATVRAQLHHPGHGRGARRAVYAGVHRDEVASLDAGVPPR